MSVPSLNSLVVQRTPEEALAFLAYWTQQLLIELRFLHNAAGHDCCVPMEVPLAINFGLLASGRTPIFIRQHDFDLWRSTRHGLAQLEAEWWQLH